MLLLKMSSLNGTSASEINVENNVTVNLLTKKSAKTFQGCGNNLNCANEPLLQMRKSKSNFRLQRANKMSCALIGAKNYLMLCIGVIAIWYNCRFHDTNSQHTSRQYRPTTSRRHFRSDDLVARRRHQHQ